MTDKGLKALAADAGARIDVFVGQALGLSRARLKALFDDGLVRRNGRKAKKGEVLAEGDEVSVKLPEEAPRDAQPDATVQLTVLHEDDSLLFIDKPSGVPSQPQESGELGTIANALVARWPALVEAGADPREAGLCHRLDIETSGVLLAAKTRVAWDAMRKAFSDAGAVDKRYLALVTGPLADEGEIEVPLAHSGNHVRPSLKGDGRVARSSFVVKQRAGAHALVEVRIFTGVLHQVRAHLAAVGAPIVGDQLYGGDDLGLGRVFLHAASLEVEHPTSGKALKVESPLTGALSLALKGLGLG